MDFDGYRRSYDRLPFRRHVDFYDEVARRFPGQRHARLESIRGFLERFRPLHVVDVGAWDGHTGLWALEQLGWLRSWESWELSSVPEPAGSEPRFRHVRLTEWPWEREPVRSRTAMVCSHVLEHMRDWQIRRLLVRHTPAWLYVDVPIGEQRPDWWGTDSAHVLELSAPELRDLVERCGYRAVLEEPYQGAMFPGTVWWFERGSG